MYNHNIRNTSQNQDKLFIGKQKVRNYNYLTTSLWGFFDNRKNLFKPLLKSINLPYYFTVSPKKLTERQEHPNYYKTKYIGT